MLFNQLVQAALLSVAAVQTAALAIGSPSNLVIKRGPLLQDIVTWDEKELTTSQHSLFVRSERVMFFSGEFHPFRLPVPSLWLDVFQKIKALGYNGVSFYVDWALLEGKPGVFNASGVFDLEPFFDAASTAGIYLLARPGPYINAEVSGGGFPGWLQRLPALLRTRDPLYEHATDLYMAEVGAIIAKAQITNGGPVILVQPENEYTGATSRVPEFPDAEYFAYVENQLRSAGIVVPLISNDASPKGYFAPGPPAKPAAVDIYGYDGYPLGFDCANPQTWPDNALPTYYSALHLNESSSTPNSIVEFQGGSFDPWGGLGFAQCLELLSPEFERVFYKNNFGQGVHIFNLYMTYGGTNWGNLGHPGGYTSYDYGAVIAEDRDVAREKYSEMKLEANFLQASPAFLTAIAQNESYANGSYTGNSALAVSALLGNVTNFFVIRHAAYNSLANTEYSITLPTSQGNITIPQLGGTLSLWGRDSKFHVTDYDVGGINLLYSTAEIFTWKRNGDKRVLIVYGGPGEEHELAISGGGQATVVEGSGVQIGDKDSATVINYNVSSERAVVELGCGLTVYLLDRGSAYDYWVVDLPNDPVSGNHTNQTYFPSTPIVKAGYLIRTIEVAQGSIHLTGDLNSTTALEIISGAPANTTALTFNGASLPFTQNPRTGVVTATAPYADCPPFTLPDLRTIGWNVLDSLPEIQPNYDDSLWTPADLSYSNNTIRNLTTPVSLYASDYGYNTGSLLYRGHFTATGAEKTLYLSTQGGSAFGHSVWLNSTFVGSFYGGDKYLFYNDTYTLPSSLTAGQHYVFTILIDNMGLDEDWTVGSETMKNPRGVLDYSLSGGHAKSDISWKLTGNLHGEDYEDKTRGPLNEGGLYAERQGYHLPGAPTASAQGSSRCAAGPMDGLAAAGVNFYSTTFELDMPVGYDIPLSFAFANVTEPVNTTGGVPAYRCQIYVNGWQFGKYVHNIGPQDVFPVPEGIFNYHGSNYVAVSLWSLEAGGASVSDLSLVAGSVIQSGFGPVGLAPMTGWVPRQGAY
ncbi:hypothetical protein LTR91_006161 [Friedmanniomyces endolithicus]|uniref:Beta-galactosidase n=1 Tax=Friedmanniomyces endolithicus TaxID=329885 RepID=A0AAN6J2F9_9PEZI|nr:hypothetical protein LTR35_012816 [Friedmanniomyces endolithicus]KAK0297444.1 hypothetical protein LTS00_004167 [Friedmanniomyces endolithicus]KAK0308609.1 hypothetical protein LTR82_015548 [Friedmanniomyces endolithicus]KAK0924410.1 hypothetical protein LTR57_005929 [Friedmanniomyces endolithicus]KAK0988998.1 hypothetical protein LTR54_012574 [Friedmanniomyces endolithicus]